MVIGRLGSDHDSECRIRRLIGVSAKSAGFSCRNSADRAGGGGVISESDSMVTLNPLEKKRRGDSRKAPPGVAPTQSGLPGESLRTTRNCEACESLR
jgi:hypothetical protein